MIGAVVTFFVGRHYYRKAGADLSRHAEAMTARFEEASDDLSRHTEAMMAYFEKIKGGSGRS